VSFGSAYRNGEGAAPKRREREGGLYQPSAGVPMGNVRVGCSAALLETA